MAFIDDQINKYAENILSGGDVNDSSALGELKFYISIRNATKSKTREVNEYEKASMEDNGVLDALADTLVQLGLVRDKSELVEKLSSEIN
ncbi:MAG: hypothetical protein NZ777_16035 [Pseudomonadales bacterium]|nr:hypothetical protein [Pseudomonadales bacterium]